MPGIHHYLASPSSELAPAPIAALVADTEVDLQVMALREHRLRLRDGRCRIAEMRRARREFWADLPSAG